MTPPPPDPRLAALVDALRRSFDGEAWHGPSLAEALGGVDARTAAARPIPGAHSVWELAGHLAAWTREVARRAGGQPPGQPREGHFPPVPAPADAAAWGRTRAELDAARDALLAAAAALPPERLDALLPPRTDGAPDEPQTYARMLAGLAEHNAYHGGQIVLLRRALGGAPNATADATPNAGAS